eukprot:m.220317 g.220317  ORF g.220317 m.220317 type:complete len:219 (+) comp39935_c0_seq34:1423-2079(+)
MDLSSLLSIQEVPVQFLCHDSLIKIQLFSVYPSIHPGISFNEQHRLEWILDVAKGISYLHSLEMNRPKLLLRSHHIMIEDDLTARINMADAVWCVSPTHKTYYPQWSPPEILKSGFKKTNMKAVNVWNFAVILFELATQKLPCAGLHPAQIGMKVAREGMALSVPENISKQISRLINVCFSYDPMQRPSFSKICPIVEQMLREKVSLMVSSEAGVSSV